MVYLKVAYNGKEFHGSQYQPDVRTVEGDILKALENEGIEVVSYRFISRTDKGVSALSNILKLEVQESINIKKLSHLLKDIWIYGKTNNDLKFPLTKTYRYYLFDKNYDEGLISKGLSFFNGNHDFFSFSKYNGTNETKRTIETRYRKEESVYVLEFIGNGFLWQMIRRIVGSVVDYAKGNISEKDIVSALNGESKINSNPFPPDYLILYNIETNSEMIYDDYVIRALKRRFNELFTDFTARRILEKESMEYMNQTEKLINRD
ncbi:MAG: hypothetical protein GX941_02150 [Candidatus Methanofastidiosa archaeon]|jgi:tRNA pseudouridine38-40 synthase|nr:hypothetical protein [Candidatus Methanofastidiosa archaeon]HOM95470.1 hypothetical protein [Methanofastidiosum sp.]HPC80637.1 hypothetical protein [Methanofastidiosum sp.]HRS25342.1 hypothetical protein [Methanofastidiosum sp.]